MSSIEIPGYYLYFVANKLPSCLTLMLKSYHVLKLLISTCFFFSDFCRHAWRRPRGECDRHAGMSMGTKTVRIRNCDEGKIGRKFWRVLSSALHRKWQNQSEKHHQGNWFSFGLKSRFLGFNLIFLFDCLEIFIITAAYNLETI